MGKWLKRSANNLRIEENVHNGRRSKPQRMVNWSFSYSGMCPLGVIQIQNNSDAPTSHTKPTRKVIINKKIWNLNVYQILLMWSFPGCILGTDSIKYHDYQRHLQIRLLSIITVFFMTAKGNFVSLLQISVICGCWNLRILSIHLISIIPTIWVLPSRQAIKKPHISTLPDRWVWYVSQGLSSVCTHRVTNEKNSLLENSSRMTQFFSTSSGSYLAGS